MSKQVFFIDQTSIERPGTEQTLADAKSILKKDEQATLKVVIDATHSGVLTNRRVYPARKVMMGYKSFFSTAAGGTAAYDKPILLHHNDYHDSVGRVKLADFKSLKSGLEFDKDYLFPDLEGGKGSGVVTVHAEITDKEAIQKIIDGRYLSVSSGHSTNQMYCSICAKSLYSETCTHIPGYRYDDEGEKVDTGDATDENSKLCYGITDNMTYHELSFVNTPAQPHAKITEFDWKLGKDALRHEIDNQFALISVSRAKKDAIHCLSVLTDKFEFSLLTGKDKPNKVKTYSVSTSTAELLEKQLTKGTGTNDEQIDSRHSSSQESSSKIESVDNKEVKEQKEVSTEKIDDIKEDKSNMDVEKMKDEITRLTAEIETLKKDLATAVKTKDELTVTTVAKDSEIASLKVSVDALKSEVALSLATALASHRIRLAKPDTKGLDSTDAKKKYIDTLAKRSIESLKDSISDLLVEIDLVDSSNTKQEATSSNQTAGDILADKKIESSIPTIDNGKKDKNKKDTSKDILATIIN